ncbi:MAG: RidA family protein [Candidatus Tectomicrobia bacterium]|nr:RidA family protein [Candidatus Tectomicrobia bacterium]
MQYEVLQPPHLPRPMGYSHAIKVTEGSLVFLAGQVALDERNQVLYPGDVVKQFEAALRNMRAILEQAGGSFRNVVKLNIYLGNRRDYYSKSRQISALYRRCFGRHYPPMTLLQVADFAYDGLMVELEAVAVV